MCCFIAALTPGIAQRTSINLQGCNSDHHAVDRMLSSEHSIIREFQSPVAAGLLRPTAILRRGNDETAARPRLSAGIPDAEMVEVSEREVDGQATSSIETKSSLDLAHSLTPAVFTGSSSDRQSSCQSSIPCPVKLNGISNTSKSADTCSGTCC